MENCQWEVEDIDDVKVSIDATLDVEEDAEVGEKRGFTAEEEAKRAKKKLKFQKLKEKKRNGSKEKFDNRMDLRTISDLEEQTEIFWNMCTENSDEKMSELEQETLQFKPADFAAVTSKTRRDDDLSSNIMKSVKHLKSADPSNGPLVVIVCLSARRCVELCKSLRSIGNVGMAKLFAKHLKLPEQIEMLKNSPRLAIGTPNRILKLCEQAHLDLSAASLFVIDLQPNMKKFSIVSLPQIKEDLFKLINKYVRTNLISQSESSKLQMMLF